MQEKFCLSQKRREVSQTFFSKRQPRCIQHPHTTLTIPHNTLAPPSQPLPNAHAMADCVDVLVCRANTGARPKHVRVMSSNRTWQDVHTETVMRSLGLDPSKSWKIWIRFNTGECEKFPGGRIGWMIVRDMPGKGVDCLEVKENDEKIEEKVEVKMGKEAARFREDHRKALARNKMCAPSRLKTPIPMKSVRKASMVANEKTAAAIAKALAAVPAAEPAVELVAEPAASSFL